MYLLFLFLLAVPAFAGLGMSYNSTSKIWTMNNTDNLPYFVNATSGFQVTNDITGFWSHNTMCIKASIVTNTITSYPVQCLDKLSWAWTNSTDNKTFANLTGTATWGIAKNYAIKITMEYYLNSTDRRIQMTPIITNVGNRSSDVWFIWRVHDIKINNSKYDNWVRLWNGSILEYRLNDSLNLSFTGLSQKSFYLHEGTDVNWAQTDWDSSNYELDIYNNGSEYNSIIDLSFYQGTMSNTGATSKKTSSKMYWIDALCSWSCGMTAPASNLQQQLGTSFMQSGKWTYISGTCPFGRTIYADFQNKTGWYHESPTTNLSTSDDNPQVAGYGDVVSWVIQAGSVAQDIFQFYNVSITCDGSRTASKQINVTAVTYPVCDLVSASTTWTANHSNCINITASNVVVDCMGYWLNTNYTTVNATYGFYAGGLTGIVIKNCKINGTNTGIILNKTNNSYTYNNTLTTIYQNWTSAGSTYVYGVQILNAENDTVVNTTMVNVSAKCTISACGGNAWGIYMDTVMNITISNDTIDTVKGNLIGETGVAIYGIYGYTANLVSISNIYVNGTAQSGIYLTGYNNTITNSVFGNETGGSILTGDPRNLTITNNKVFGTGTGISINKDMGYDCQNTIVRNNSVQNVTNSVGTTCFYVQASNCYFNNNTLMNCSKAISSYGGANNIFGNFTIGGGSITDYYGLFSGGGSINNTLFNVTGLTQSKITVIGTSNVTLWWYNRINITNSTGGGLPANVNVSMLNGTSEFAGTAGADGNTTWFASLDAVFGQGATAWNNHTINVSYTGYQPNSTSFNISFSGTINITLYLAPVDTTPPTVTFELPTPANGAILTVKDVRVNVSSGEPTISALLDFNGTWYSMTALNSTSWNYILLFLPNGNYTYNVTMNDSVYNQGMSETRTVIINYTTSPSIPINFSDPQTMEKYELVPGPIKQDFDWLPAILSVVIAIGIIIFA